MSNTFGSCASGSVAAPMMVATIAIRVRLLRRLPRIWLAIHSSTSVSTSIGLGRRPALDRGVRRQRHRARRHRQARCGRGVMRDRLGEQIVEAAVVAALGGGVVDLEQRFGFGAADRLMLDGGRGQDARAPGGVIGIQRAGKMDTAFGGRAFAGDHAIADDGRGVGGGIAAGRLRARSIASAALVPGADIVVHFSFSCSGPAFPCGRKRVVNDSKLGVRGFLDGCRLVAVIRHGSRMSEPGRCDGAISGKIGAIRRLTRSDGFSPQARDRKKVLEACPYAEKDFSFCMQPFT